MTTAACLPRKGFYCVDLATPKGFRHRFFERLDSALEYALAQDARGEVAYLAQATFRTPENRKQSNVLWIRSFWLDIDCGPKWPLKDQREGVDSLKRFVEATGLPFPEVTTSGNGLYAHWPLVEEVSERQWKMVATVLKTVVMGVEPKLQGDSSRTSDSSSVLRPPGTHNRKDPQSPKEVRILKQGTPVALTDFATLLGAAVRKYGLSVDRPAVPRGGTMPSEFDIPSTPSDPHEIADKCSQVGHFRDLQGNVPEPVWYAMIGLLRHTVGGREVIHEWSSGHPEYDIDATNDKILQHERSGAGPATCRHLSECSPGICTGCRYANKIRSPIVLGNARPDALPVPLDTTGAEIPAPPAGFRRSEDGLYCEVDGVWTRFYPYDMHPVGYGWDATQEKEVSTWRHFLPHSGWQEFATRSSTFVDSREMQKTMADHHISLLGQREANMMQAYTRGYLAELRKHRKMASLYSQMGWQETQDGPVFVLGERIVSQEGITQAGLANAVPVEARAFHTKGDPDQWRSATRVFRHEGMESRAFAFLVGFGSPLMRFTGFEGAMVSLVGLTGVAKTLLSRWTASIYGDHSKLILTPQDTHNSFFSRLGLYNTLPLVIDEITNVDPAVLSSLVYQITQGREKLSLTRERKERKNVNRWQTLALATCNAPGLAEKLISNKADSTAEMSRLFEFWVESNGVITQQLGTYLYRVFSENYGHAGQRYVEHLVQTHDTHREKLDALIRRIRADADTRPEERFWEATVAVVIYGGLLAKQLGLIDFEVMPVYRWAIEQIRKMREQKDEEGMGQDAVTVLSGFIDRHTNNRLVVDVQGRSNASRLVLTTMAPRGPLIMRQETGDGEVGKLFISRAAVRRWLTESSMNYNHVKRELEHSRILVATRRKSLGAGTEYEGGPVPCWVIDLEHPVLQGSHLSVVNTLKSTEKLRGAK